MAALEHLLSFKSTALSVIVLFKKKDSKKMFQNELETIRSRFLPKPHYLLLAVTVDTLPNLFVS